MLIIDAHTHIFPEETAEQLLQATARMFGVPTFGRATASDLLGRMDECGISHSVIHMVAPTASGVTGTNSWLLKLKQDRLIKFGTLHPQFKNCRDEVRRLRDGGVRGIKFQPDVQQFAPDDRTLTYPVYEEIASAGLAVMFHVGGEPLPSPNDRSKPSMIRAVALDFPDMPIIAAHLGGLNMWDDVYALIAGLPNLYMESSLSYGYIRPEVARRIIEKHGHKRIFFGTDYPFGDIRQSLAAACSVPFLSVEEKEDILGLNARRFFLES